jgi:GcrA cell cycle regulator
MSWTDERVVLLKKLWGEGKTAAEIAKELGDVTRNAVIGKAHRLKLSSRVSPIQQNAKKVQPKAANEGKRPPRRVANDALMASIKVKRVSLADLGPRMCRWPLGDPQEDDFSFCGCEIVPSLPYCLDHAKVAYQSASKARKLKAEDFDDKKQKESSVDALKEAVSA